MNYRYLKNMIPFIHNFPFNLLKEDFDNLCDFFNLSKNLCCIYGPEASFKTDLINYSLNYLDDNVLVFKFNCFEATTLDDILLSIFDDLKKYSQQKKVSFFKLETNDFSQKVNTYINHINLPCLLIIDSFENILNKANPIEKEQIFSYIKHLLLNDKFKIVLISKNETKLFDDVDKYTLLMTKFNEDKVKKYFDHYSIENNPNSIKQFCQITKGCIFPLLLTVNIIQTLKIPLDSILDEFKFKKIQFEKFLMSKIITFVPEHAKKTLFYLSLYKSGISETFLIKEGFLTKEQISYLLEKGILKNENGYIFVKSYFSQFLSEMVAPSEKIKIYKFWISFFESQLPLKPTDRVVLLSRSTMRSQIEYNNSFLPQQANNIKQYADMSLMSYLNSNLTDWNIKNTNAQKSSTDNKVKNQNNATKDKQFEKYELTKEELSLLNNPIDLRQKQEESLKENLYRTIEQREENFLKQKQQDLDDIYSRAEVAKEEHDYNSEYTLLCSMLSYKNDSKFYEYEPKILNALAICSVNLNKTIDAIDFYNKLIELYKLRSDEINIQETKLKIATIYKDSFKINHARVIYENFINKNTKIDKKILLKSYIELADIEEGLSNIEKSIELYKKAFSLYEESIDVDKNYIANAYYKYALILDDFNQLQAALDYYQKCIRLAEGEPLFLASALVNFAEILKEQGNIVKAVEAFKRALFIDESLANHEGVYYISLKLSQIAEISAPELVEDLLLKSLKAAGRTNEYGYIVNAHIELGDYYQKVSLSEKALREYLTAKVILDKQNIDNSDFEQIELRINYIKNNISADFYNKIISEVENSVIE